MNRLRREIWLSQQGNKISVELKDNFHHFKLSLQHDDKTIRQVASESICTPWSTCSGAPQALNKLQGLALDSDKILVINQDQCLHLMDLVLLAKMHYFSDAKSTHFEIDILRGESKEDTFTAALTKNNVQLLSWSISTEHVLVDKQGLTIPRNYVGAISQEVFKQWATKNLETDIAEVAVLLDRAIMVSDSLFVNWSNKKSSAELKVPHFCFTHNEARASKAFMTPEGFLKSSELLEFEVKSSSCCQLIDKPTGEID